jgi:uncharacterized Tic20 family protein
VIWKDRNRKQWKCEWPRQKSKLKLGEALLVLSPFLAFILIYGLLTGTLIFNGWPPQIENSAAFFMLVVYCAVIYAFTLMNLHARRQEEWKRYRDGLTSAIIVIMM